MVRVVMGGKQIGHNHLHQPHGLCNMLVLNNSSYSPTASASTSTSASTSYAKDTSVVEHVHERRE